MTTEGSTQATQSIKEGIKNFITNIIPKSTENINIEEGLSAVNNVIPKETKEYLLQTKDRILNPAYIRPPKEFFGVGEERPFFLEKERALVYERVNKNLRYFYLNYGLFATLLFCVSLVFGSGVFVHVIALVLAWGVVIKATEKGSFEYKGFSVTQKEATTVMSIITIFVLMAVLKEAFWGAFWTSSVFICAHAGLRDSESFVLEEESSGPGVGEGTSLLGK